jgi:hypothetical protein
VQHGERRHRDYGAERRANAGRHAVGRLEGNAHLVDDAERTAKRFHATLLRIAATAGAYSKPSATIQHAFMPQGHRQNRP